MTAQVLESLRYLGRDYALFDRPLDACKRPDVRARMRRLRMAWTSHRRGYVGSWEIKRRRLWLVGLGTSALHSSGTFEEYDEQRGLAWLFYGEPAPVFAVWYTGTLASPRGVGAWRDGEYTWPSWREFTVERGVVMSTALRR